MIDISNITYEDKNLKTIVGCIILNMNHKYFKNFTHNLKSHFNGPFAHVSLQSIQNWVSNHFLIIIQVSYLLIFRK